MIYITFFEIGNNILCVVITNVICLEIGEKVLMVRLWLWTFKLGLWEYIQIKLAAEFFYEVILFVLFVVIINVVIVKLLKYLMLFDLSNKS